MYQMLRVKKTLNERVRVATFIGTLQLAIQIFIILEISGEEQQRGMPQLELV